jgi:hypothetical protein
VEVAFRAALIVVGTSASNSLFVAVGGEID